MKETQTAAFISCQDIVFTDSGEYNRHDILIDNDTIMFNNHHDVYIPIGINKINLILYLLYDYELTKDNSGYRPTKVLYTDFFRSKNFI